MKNKQIAILLCFFTGVFGIHRFYLGQVGTGLVQLFTFGGFGIWTFIDFIMLILQSEKDFEKKFNKK